MESLRWASPSFHVWLACIRSGACNPATAISFTRVVLTLSTGQVEAILVDAGLMEAPEKAEPEAGGDEEEQPEEGGVFFNTEVG